MREGASGYEKPLLSPARDRQNGKGEGATQTGKEEKSGYPLIHSFKEVNLIKTVVMKMLRAR